MKKISLVIMAAGIGSRYGEGIKQLASVGENGNIIMDYSVHDAIEAGFNEIIFVIRKEIEEDFMKIIGRRIEAICDQHNVGVYYVNQSLYNLPKGFSVPEGRTKPWGTGKAVLSGASLLDHSFAVINADDYYGKKAFVSIADFLRSSDTPNEYCMAGFRLGNTLSDNGTVTRGVCQQTDDGCLSGIEEIHDITRNPDGSASSPAGDLPADSLVSMNMWGFKDGFVSLLEEGFRKFLVRLLSRRIGDPMNDEFLIPVFVEDLLRQKKVRVRVLPSDDQWYGITYKEDIPSVRKAFADMTAKGLYRSDLYSDLQ
ncbi:MAG: nucleotidyltransferase [Lachnospiraceae bacterium]|nr:nucleotidyltransferase [Lachnospiraceae bacterium]MDD7326324.1 nucleotidyltransferase [Lachnospiraceae bacterium]MDY2759783.1 nucleotidyltransferase [Lachnospiraceae bacterium]